jgi:hypothetical protein
MGDNQLVNLGELSKPATALIEKISEAVGGLFRPYQIKRIAKAEAEAGLIQAESAIQITELHRRAMHRFVEEEAKKQENIEKITQQALPHLSESAEPTKVEGDWITNFFDKCRIVSDQEMQQLWAQVLAGEANSPGMYSKRTVNLLGDLDKSDAELFRNLCGLGWSIGNVVPLVFDPQAEIYNKIGINFTSLSHLESLGLIQFNAMAGFQRLRLPKVITVAYYGAFLTLSFPNDSDNSMELGKVLLTKAGQELAPVCGSRPIHEFYDYIYDKWAENSYVPKRIVVSES